MDPLLYTSGHVCFTTSACLGHCQLAWIKTRDRKLQINVSQSILSLQPSKPWVSCCPHRPRRRKCTLKVHTSLRCTRKSQKRLFLTVYGRRTSCHIGAPPERPILLQTKAAINYQRLCKNRATLLPHSRRDQRRTTIARRARKSQLPDKPKAGSIAAPSSEKKWKRGA